MNATSAILDPVMDRLHGILPSIFYKLVSIVLPSDPLPTGPVSASSAAAENCLASSLQAWPILTPLMEVIQHHSNTTKPALYELEPHIAALAIFFCRFVIISGSLTASPDGHTSVLGKSTIEFGLRLGMSIILAGMAYMRMDYDVICSVHLWSHVLPTLLGWCVNLLGKNSGEGKKGSKKQQSKKKKAAESPPPSLTMSIGISTLLLVSLPSCLYMCRLFSNLTFLSLVIQQVPTPVSNAFHYMFPIEELAASYDIVTSFVSDKELLHDMLAHLLFVTFHIQMGLGHIGIAFLTSEQRRKNMLIRMDVENPNPNTTNGGNKKKGKKEQNVNGEHTTKKMKFDPSRKFRRTAPSFILFAVLPYMFQIILFGNLNKFAFMNVQNQIHRSVRIQELFDHDSHLTAIASESATSPDVYAGSMDTVVATGERICASIIILLLLGYIVATW
jgi:hypothetical protein